MYICFKLTMPNVGSWNGKWSGEGKLYARVIRFGQKKTDVDKAKQILDKHYFHYSWGDGWGAGITVTQVDDKEALKIRRKSDGFYGYDWMIDSIIKRGVIKSEEDIKAEQASQSTT